MLLCIILVYDNLNWDREVLKTSNGKAHWHWESNVTCVNFDAKEVVFFYEMSLWITLVSKTTCKPGGVCCVGINGIFWSLNPKDNLDRVSIKWKTLLKFRI